MIYCNLKTISKLFEFLQNNAEIVWQRRMTKVARKLFKSSSSLTSITQQLSQTYSTRCPLTFLLLFGYFWNHYPHLHAIHFYIHNNFRDVFCSLLCFAQCERLFSDRHHIPKINGLPLVGGLRENSSTRTTTGFSLSMSFDHGGWMTACLI